MSHVQEALVARYKDLEQTRRETKSSISYHDLHLSRLISRRDEIDAAMAEIEAFLKPWGINL